jgi:RNA polymerase sigma factor (TIGR02999 family)
MHYTIEELEDYFSGEMPEHEAAAVEEHLGACDLCLADAGELGSIVLGFAQVIEASEKEAMFEAPNLDDDGKADQAPLSATGHVTVPLNQVNLVCEGSTPPETVRWPEFMGLYQGGFEALERQFLYVERHFLRIANVEPQLEHGRRIRGYGPSVRTHLRPDEAVKEASQRHATVAGVNVNKSLECPESIIQALQTGNREADRQRLEVVYGELHRMASRFIRAERREHTLHATSLLSEACIRLLVDMRDKDWQNRAHFFGVAAQVMRRILVDDVRMQRTAKRARDQHNISLGEALPVTNEHSDELVALDEALSRLAQFDSRQSRVVELRFSGGLTEEETAEALGVSRRTVKREWKIAKAWLYAELKKRFA